MVCHLFGAKQLSQPMQGYYQLSIGPLGNNFSEIVMKKQRVSFKKRHFKMSSAKMVTILPGGGGGGGGGDD